MAYYFCEGEQYYLIQGRIVEHLESMAIETLSTTVRLMIHGDKCTIETLRLHFDCVLKAEYKGWNLRAFWLERGGRHDKLTAWPTDGNAQSCRNSHPRTG